MTNPGPQSGWKVRRDKAAAKREATDDREAIRAERYRMEREKIDAGLAVAAAAAELKARSRVTCPCCGSDAPLDPEVVARLITAVGYLPNHVPTDATVRNALRAIVDGKEIDRSLIFGEKHRGMHVPRRIYAEAPAPETAAHGEPATVTPKEQPITPPKPRRKPTAAELFAAGGDEGALDLSED